MTGLSQLIRPRALTPPLFKKKLQEPQSTISASLDCAIDTSPIVILNDDDDSDSSTITGSLILDVTEDTVEVESLYAVLRVHVVHKKPFKKGCKDCKRQLTELKRCQFIKTTTTMDCNTHSFPFSYRVPSYVPPTMDTSLVSVSYEFEAVASLRRKGQLSKAPEVITLNSPLPVARSISVPNSPSRSSRIFQSAGIEVGCSFGPVVDPNNKNTASLTMTGLRSCPGNGDNLQFWRICKGTWTLEETTKTTAMPCTHHAQQDGAVREEGQAQKKTSILGDSTFYDGWTTNDDLGTLNMDFPFSIKKGAKYTQDTGDVGDTSVTHALVLELVLMKECYPKGRPDQAVRTGAGRILRSEHRVVLSDYARHSNHTTEESLPCYQDLWPGPPMYKEEHVGME
ncbi:Endocytosis regulator [Fusarium torreyae]|uniref:Endocytosis regulator n=1 Tax=Fusarium torreyae TaxID=1237075 RepID=A0A9W8RXK3_9HYPO|nr:Endocytosis regulator [Fusarium torreyae]